MPTDAPTPAPSPTVPALGMLRTRSVDGMIEVWVPAGSFQMGTESGWESEKPVHTVTLDGFWLDQTEVTNAQYRACVAADRCSEHDYPLSSDFNAPHQPVVEVTWFDASDYCEWVGARLPTEAEWEYAARGPEGYLYPWGNDFREGIANCEESVCKDGYEWTTAPVGSFPEGASWVGALDMAGNVWEWVADWFDVYPSTPQTNPTGPSTGELRVTRGGDYDNDEIYMRSVHREEDLPTATYDSLGFRCARSERP
jgi:eukaryotic-like serine/threonine-protein kinase